MSTTKSNCPRLIARRLGLGDQQAYLDFAYVANAEVATLAKQPIAQYYGKPAAFSYSPDVPPVAGKA